MKYTPFDPVEIETLLESKLNEAAQIDTSPYETVNDDSPAGRGTWTFSVDKYPSHPADYGTLERDGKLVDITDDYKNAVNQVKKQFPSAKTIYLLP